MASTSFQAARAALDGAIHLASLGLCDGNACQELMNGLLDGISRAASVLVHIAQEAVEGAGTRKTGFRPGDQLKPCPWHKAGTCRYGEHCWHSHDHGSPSLAQALGCESRPRPKENELSTAPSMAMLTNFDIPGSTHVSRDGSSNEGYSEQGSDGAASEQTWTLGHVKPKGGHTGDIHPAGRRNITMVPVKSGDDTNSASASHVNNKAGHTADHEGLHKPGDGGVKSAAAPIRNAMPAPMTAPLGLQGQHMGNEHGPHTRQQRMQELDEQLRAEVMASLGSSAET